ncbi:TIGR04104 family putative zinc finger protein [Clostridium sp. YIM B02551]|uniref:TIGR04104 family putative zinc finger protein n=1 Tax=Clostridium sp. YIM B02551 TaxID=2910679 RepID=UPI001EEB85FC|nr:TIGR04104 family putative zinc finger protein [Clostridium sp. YIM B02551]
MVVQKCEKCSKEFPRKDIVKSVWSWSGYKPIVCEGCKSVHYVNIATRLLLSVCISAPIFSIPFIFKNNNFLKVPFQVYLIVYILWIVLITYLTPFFARYHVKE